MVRKHSGGGTLVPPYPLLSGDSRFPELTVPQKTVNSNMD